MDQQTRSTFSQPYIIHVLCTFCRSVSHCLPKKNKLLNTLLCLLLYLAALLQGSSSSIQDCLDATCLPQSQRWFASEGDCVDHFFIRVMEFSSARGSTLLYRWGRIARHGSSLSTCKGLSLAGGFLENCVSPLDDDADDGAV